MALGLALVGFTIGVSLMVIWGILEGLFGRWILALILAVFGVAFIVQTFTVGIETAAAQIAPWEYWLGFIIGSLIGLPVAHMASDDIRRNGVPLVVSVVRGE